MNRTILVIAIFLEACVQPANLTAPAVETSPGATVVPSASTATQPAMDNSPISSLPAGPISLVALGDSLTEGDGDESGRGYPGRLWELVHAVRPGTTITNLGRSGWNSDALINGDQGIESQLDRAVVELQAATSQGRGAAAFVWIGSNDLWYLYEYGGDGSDEGDRQDAEHFASNVDLILSRLRGTGAAVFVALLDDQSLRPVVSKGEAFTSITQDELSRMSAQAVRYNAIIVSMAGQYGVSTVDFYHTDIFTNPATLYDDGSHPNPSGYDIIAQKWWEALLPLLAE